MNVRRTGRLAAGLLAALLTTVVGAGIAHADGAPAAWQEKTNICQTLSLYGYNPGYGGVTHDPDHQVSGYKRLYWTTGEIVHGWVPVYSAGQEEWHTQWVRQECLEDGWNRTNNGHVDF